MITLSKQLANLWLPRTRHPTGRHLGSQIGIRYRLRLLHPFWIAFRHRTYDLVLSGKARDAMDLNKEAGAMRERYGLHTFGQSLLMARRLIEAGTRFVQVNWPSVANGNPETTSWDTHAANFGPLKNLHCPKLDRGLSALLEDLDQRGLLEDTIVVAVGEFGRSPRLGVSTSGNSN